MGSTAESTDGELDNNIVTATPVNRKEVDDVAIQETVEEVAKAASHRQDVIRVAHIMSHEIGHGEPVNILFVALSLSFSFYFWSNLILRLSLFVARSTAARTVGVCISLWRLLEWRWWRPL